MPNAGCSSCHCSDHPIYRLAFVTGASSGIGAAFCRLLAQKGVPLLMTGRDLGRLEALADELRPLVPVEVISTDIGTAAGRLVLVEAIRRHVPDLIVNNAGFGLYGETLTYETDQMTEMVEVNVNGVVELTIEGARTLIASGRKGTILNVSSSADLLVFPGLAVYAASKAFVTQFSQSIDYELKRRGVRVLVSCPGVVKSDFRRRAAGLDRPTEGRAAMDVAFAAKQLWRQIARAKGVCRFDFKTRIGAFIGRNLLPKALVARVLFGVTERYHPERKLILGMGKKNQ